jgi:hypothetical protein
MLHIRLDENNYVDGYGDGCEIDGGFWYDGPVHDGFGPTTCRFYRHENNVLILDEAKQQAAQDAEAAIDELIDLYTWFEWYDVQVHQALRAERMNNAFSAEDSSGQTYESLADLDAQAAVYQVRIRDIREGDE